MIRNMYMRIFLKAAVAAAFAGTLVVASCSRNVYDEEEYKKILKYLSPVDSIDQQHEWELCKLRTYTFTASRNSDAVQVQVYTENPLTSKSAQMMGNTYISAGQQAQLALSVPLARTTLYAAQVGADGRLTVTQFYSTDSKIDFSGVSNTGESLKLSSRLAAFSYLYEESCPVPDDYDYNDVVFRISQERTGEKCISVTVTLVAVGASSQLAGAIHLSGYQKADIDSVTTDNGAMFNDGLPSSFNYYFDGHTDMLMEGRNGEAVIQLFQDAHWALYPDVEVENGIFTRLYLNTSMSNGGDSKFVPRRSITYHVYFKSEKDLNLFTLDSLDPFVVNNYNGGFLEIHTYPYRDAQCMYNYSLPEVKDLPWALKVPYTRFRHALEGSNLGFKRDGAMFGAYMTVGHGFGEWCEDRNSALDWYLYPTRSYIY